MEEITPETTDTSEVPDIDAPIETFAPVNVPSTTAEHVEKIEVEKDKDDTSTDLFSWANQTDAVKNDLNVEFFLFNRNYTPFTTKIDNELDSQIKALFLFDVINEVNLGAGTGLSVRDYELVESEENVILRTDLAKVGRAETLIHLIEKERSDIVEFSEQEHEFKRMKGIIARYSRKSDGKGVFYIVKQVSAGLQGATAWEFSEGGFRAFKPEFGWKVPGDNQVLIVDGDIFIYNQSKFERLFNYDYKKQLLADAKVAEIEKQYKLSFPGDVTLQSLVMDRKKIVSKLQKLEVGAISQDQAIDYADTMELELMTDDAGAIIIMDGNDLDMFVNLINEDYITSEITGKRYEIKSKKLLGEPEGEPPRG
ncbi:MAG: Kiwa anti-phage protein KwaB-like domain-containing protein [Candidatus Microsaccharimonas sp.]